MKTLVKTYGRDVVDLVSTIKTRLQTYLSNRSFVGTYVETLKFEMIPSSNIGLFVVTFPGSRPVALAGIDMLSGDYILKSEKDIPVYKLDGLNMNRLIKAAESDWADAPQKLKNPGEIVDFSLRL